MVSWLSPQGHQYLGGLRPDVISFSQAMGKGSWHWALQHYGKATEMAVQPEAWRENWMILRWSYGVLYWCEDNHEKKWWHMRRYEKLSWYELILYMVHIYFGLFLRGFVDVCVQSIVNLASCRFDFLDALGKRKNAQTKPASRKISSAQSKDLQMFNILLAALCSTGTRWARAFDLLRLRCQAEPWR